MTEKNPKIRVLGSGCPTCKKLYENTQRAVSELGLGVDVEYINDIQIIIDSGILTMPAVTLNGKAIISGFTPNIEKIKTAISNNL